MTRKNVYFIWAILARLDYKKLPIAWAHRELSLYVPMLWSVVGLNLDYDATEKYSDSEDSRMRLEYEN